MMNKFDEIGYWSELKLEIIKKYANAYSTILNAGKNPSFSHIYIDAFSGYGVHISRATGEFITGSPINALEIQPPFKEYHFIDLDGDKIDFLRKRIGNRTDVFYYKGDCNKILLEEVFPKCRYEDYKRALCLLDPYGLHLDWEVISQSSKCKTLEIFINFPTMDMNRNVFFHPCDISKVSKKNLQRMNMFWGDDSWKEVVYVEEPTLFGPQEVKSDNIEIAQKFEKRIREKAGFQYVAEPLPMRNKIGAIIYYLFFASHKPVAKEIVNDIFRSYWYKGFVK